MERKFKVGDRVKDSYESIAKVVYVSQNEYSTKPYCVEFSDKSIGCFPETSFTLIEPERKYQKGDGSTPSYDVGENVWHIPTSSIWAFESYDSPYQFSCFIKNGDSVMRVLFKDIEPYDYQDLQIHLQNLRGKKESPKPAHPYTVILKSGVKVKISTTMFDYINKRDAQTTSVETVEDGSFTISEIAAIVPTENIVP